MSKFVTKKLKPVYQEIDDARKELNRLIDAMPRQRSGVPEMNVRIMRTMEKIQGLLLQFSNIHAEWRAK